MKPFARYWITRTPRVATLMVGRAHCVCSLYVDLIRTQCATGLTQRDEFPFPFSTRQYYIHTKVRYRPPECASYRGCIYKSNWWRVHNYEENFCGSHRFGEYIWTSIRRVLRSMVFPNSIAGVLFFVSTFDFIRSTSVGCVCWVRMVQWKSSVLCAVVIYVRGYMRALGCLKLCYSMCVCFYTHCIWSLWLTGCRAAHVRRSYSFRLIGVCADCRPSETRYARCVAAIGMATINRCFTFDYEAERWPESNYTIATWCETKFDKAFNCATKPMEKSVYLNN